jgi:PilZ domain-containing protein
MNAKFQAGRGAFAVEYFPFLQKGHVMDQERRRAQRFPFIASAEVLSESAGTRLAARISDISATGCYVDTINPLVHGSAVRLKILTETHVFEAPATVVYSHTHLGMGLIFGEVLPNFQDVLQNWLPVAT